MKHRQKVLLNYAFVYSFFRTNRTQLTKPISWKRNLTLDGVHLGIMLVTTRPHFPPDTEATHLSPYNPVYRRRTPEAPVWTLISLARIIPLPIMVQGSTCAFFIHTTLTLILYFCLSASKWFVCLDLTDKT